MKAQSIWMAIALLVLLPLEAPAQFKSWAECKKTAESAGAEKKYREAAGYYAQALTFLAEKHPAETDGELRKLMFYNIPECIENLSLTSDFDTAKKLAQQKLQASEKAFGTASEFALDAMQDELFVLNQAHDRTQANERFWQYVSTARAMRSDGEGAKVDEAQLIRRERLQKKLNQAIARLKSLNM